MKPRRADERVGSHSLRKNVIPTLQGSKVAEERRRAYVGHEARDGGDDVYEAAYMRRGLWKNSSKSLKESGGASGLMLRDCVIF